MVRGIGFFAAAAAVLLAGCGRSAGTGRIHLAETSFDFGKVALGQPAVHSFRIGNEGDGPLVLQKEAMVRALEGC